MNTEDDDTYFGQSWGEAQRKSRQDLESWTEQERKARAYEAQRKRERSYYSPSDSDDYGGMW